MPSCRIVDASTPPRASVEGGGEVRGDEDAEEDDIEALDRKDPPLPPSCSNRLRSNIPASNDELLGVPPATVAEDPIPAARPNRGPAAASLDETPARFGLKVLTVPNLGLGPADDDDDDDDEALRSLSC